MTTKRLPRSQVRITDTLAHNAERYFTERGQSLPKPQEIHDASLTGLVLRRQPTGREVWH